MLIVREGKLDCDVANARSDADGWTFKKTISRCDGSVTEQFWYVTHDGQVSDAGRKTLEEATTECEDG